MREIDIAFGVSRDVMARSQNAGRLDRAHDIERLAINDGNAFVGAHIQELLSSAKLRANVVPVLISCFTNLSLVNI